MKGKIREIANEVRYEIEEMAQSGGYKYSLNGLCAIASTILFERFREAEIKAKIHIAIDKPKTPKQFNEFHVFIVSSGFVIDVTASQFDTPSENYPNVLIRQQSKLKGRIWWDSYKIFQTKQELIDWMQIEGICETITPELYKTNLLSILATQNQYT